MPTKPWAFTRDQRGDLRDVLGADMPMFVADLEALIRVVRRRVPDLPKRAARDRAKTLAALVSACRDALAPFAVRPTGAVIVRTGSRDRTDLVCVAPWLRMVADVPGTVAALDSVLAALAVAQQANATPAHRQTDHVGARLADGVARVLAAHGLPVVTTHGGVPERVLGIVLAASRDDGTVPKDCSVLLRAAVKRHRQVT